VIARCLRGAQSLSFTIETVADRSGVPSPTAITAKALARRHALNIRSAFKCSDPHECELVFVPIGQMNDGLRLNHAVKGQNEINGVIEARHAQTNWGRLNLIPFSGVQKWRST